MKLKVSILIILFVIFTANCSSAPDYKEFNKNLSFLASEAKQMAKTGRPEEAAKIMELIYNFHPDDSMVKEILASLTVEQREAITGSSLLGYNKSKRPKVEPSTLEKVVWYIPDRFFDLVDTVTVEVSIGPQIGGGIWVTRAVQAVAYTGTSSGIGIYQKKHYVGMRGLVSFELVIGPVGVSAVAGSRLGLGGLDLTARTTLLHTPSKPIYQEFRDYWAVGAKAGIFIIGMEFEIHPVEIFDFLAGIILIDPMNDDYATTRGFQYTQDQKRKLEIASEALKDMGEKGVKEYKKQFSKLDYSDPAIAPPSNTPIGEAIGKEIKGKKKK
ncbi:MAG: hypothetical protein L6Q54_14990 [Leptospiraceae bacterium]|nr:hypothetical protein [Leptospiraceae bacterium]